MSASIPPAPRVTEPSYSAAARPPGTSLARLGAGELVWIDKLDRSRSASTPVVLAPGEDILVLAVELPLASHKQRRDALPFAMEEHLADPLEATHLALGPALGANRYLAAAVRHTVMQDWMAQLEAAGLDQARLTPDALALPEPEDGVWSALAEGERVLARTAEGPAFATDRAGFLDLWQASGRPRLSLYGEPLPAPFPQDDPRPFSFSVAAPHVSLDLRQGAYAPRRGSPALLRRAAAVLVAGAAANLLLFALDTALLQRQARAAQAEAAAVLRDIAPAQRASADPAADLIALLPAAAQDRGGAFLPLLSRTSAALLPYKQNLSVQTLGYSTEGPVLNLDLEAQDLQTLQRIETALEEAGLAAESGAATTERGGAQARVSVRGAGA